MEKSQREGQIQSKKSKKDQNTVTITQKALIQKDEHDSIKENSNSSHLINYNNDSMPNFEKQRLQRTVYQCEFCDHKSALFSSLKKHYLTDHPNENEPSKTSTLFWNKKGIEHDFESQTGLMNSLPNPEVYKTAPRTCPICGVTFSGMRGYGYLKTHILVVHEGKKPHQCHICKKSFGTIPNRNKHMRTVHEGMKRQSQKYKYPCEQCNHVASR